MFASTLARFAVCLGLRFLLEVFLVIFLFFVL